MNRTGNTKEILWNPAERQAANEIDMLRDMSAALSSLNYFYDALDKVFIDNDIEGFFKSGKINKPVIGIYCVMVPEELILAAGAYPVRLCAGSFDGARAGEDMLPRDCCPLVKSSMGLAVKGGLKIFDMCDAVIIPTTCDSKRKLGEELSSIKEVWMLEVPHIKDTEFSKRIWFEQIWALKAKLEKFRTKDGRSCGKITAKNLANAVGNTLKAQVQMRRLLDIRKLFPPVIRGTQAAAAANSYAYLPAEDWARNMERLNDQLSEKIDKNEPVCRANSPRIFVAGSPSVFPNLKIPSLIEEMGGIVVADESCAGDRYIYDPVGNTERGLKDQITALASRYMAPCVCPSFAPNDDRMIMIRRIIRDYAIDGVVYHVLKGCIIYDFELIRVENLLKEYNIPVIRVETDYNPEDVEQLRTRIEAFMEMIKTGKRSVKKEVIKDETVLCGN